jgi:hypothetical protein
MGKQKPTNKKRDQAITLAIIGAVVTIMTALISSVIGPIVLEFMRRTPVPSASASSLSPIAVTNPSQLNSPTQTPVPVVTLTTTAGTSMATQDWRQMMAVNIESAWPLLCQGLLLPPNIRPDQDINQAAKQVIAEARATNNQFDSWLLVSHPGINKVNLLLTITNMPNHVDWIKLENKLDVSIDAQSNPPKQVNVLTSTGCGAGGLYRKFSDVSLASEYQNYTTTSASTEFDFFTLQPGESEILQLPLTCQAPGIYSATLNIHYSILESDSIVQVEYERSIVCPSAFTIWTIEMADEAFVSSTSYLWNGTAYERQP